ncbi:MAG: hypothetical protein AAGI63_00265 [Planctomycetota bacterium]
MNGTDDDISGRRSKAAHRLSQPQPISVACVYLLFVLGAFAVKTYAPTALLRSLQL